MLFHVMVMLFSVDSTQVATTSADKQGGGDVVQLMVAVSPKQESGNNDITDTSTVSLGCSTPIVYVLVSTKIVVPLATTL